MARQKLIVGNWKMNTTLDEAINLANGIIAKIEPLKDTTVIVCPPYINIPVVRDLIKGTGIKLGAQNLYFEERGAFTSKISGEMLASHGVEYVLIGHSEVRGTCGDTNEIVALKLKRALEHNIMPILCVGEKLNERDSNQYKTVIDEQIRTALDGIDKETIKKITIGYEPVWAIGTGLSAMPAHANEINKYIREILTELYNKETADQVPTIYGGSINAANIAEFIKEEEIDGVIMGGSSLKPDEFTTIIKAVDNS